MKIIRGNTIMENLTPEEVISPEGGRQAAVLRFHQARPSAAAPTPPTETHCHRRKSSMTMSDDAIARTLRCQRCQQCQRRYRHRKGDWGDWNAVCTDGVVVAVLCPACQTSQENAEATINEATLDYSVNELGRFYARPKT